MTIVLMAVPIIPARDLISTATWYEQVLRFAVRHVEDRYGIVERNGVQIHFWGPSGIEPQDSTTMFRLGVSGIEALHEACIEAGIVHPNAPLEQKAWGTHEFAVTDCDGNLITFFESST